MAPFIVDAFSKPFTTPSEGQHSPRPQPQSGSRHTGLCWFAGPDYPDTAVLEERIRRADDPTDETSVPDVDFNRALANGFLNMSTDATGEQPFYPSPCTSRKVWDTVIATGPSHAVRQYLLESCDKDTVFMGSARLDSIVGLMEIATALDVSGVDLSGISPGGPWHYEFFSAGDSTALWEAVATCRKEHNSSSEHWLACGHYGRVTMNFGLFYAEDASHALSLTAESLVEIDRADDASQFFRAALFWRGDACTAACTAGA